MIDTVRTIGSSIKTIRASIIAIAILRAKFILFLGFFVIMFNRTLVKIYNFISSGF